MKWIKLFFATIVITAGAISPVIAEEVPEPSRSEYFRHSLGLAASSVSGAGLSYKFAFVPLFHWRVSGLYFASKSNNQFEEFYNAGSDLQFSVFHVQTSRTGKMRGYIALGGSYWVESKQVTEAGFSSASEGEDAHFGGAFGLETVFYNRIAAHVEIGYAHYRQLGEDSYTTTFAGAFGLSYLF